MPRPDRVRLVVLFGGQSAEHEVSCVSAYHVLRAVDEDRYDLEAVGITREGDWVRADDAIAALHRGAGELPAPTSGIDRLEATGTAVEPLPAVTPAVGDDVPVVVLPLLHGPRGEDGTVQGMLELAGVPFVGAGVLGSALCMDKLKAKDVLAAHGTPAGARGSASATPSCRRHAGASTRPGSRYPLFVKPANLGSSVGVSRVVDEAGARRRRGAGRHLRRVDRRRGGRPRPRDRGGRARQRRATRVGARARSSRATSSTTTRTSTSTVPPTSSSPPTCPTSVTEEIQRLAVEAFTALRCDGMARVDFFYEEDGRGLLLNEVNTIPGFTPISMYPKLWAASGLPYDQLIDELVRLALERHDRRSRFSTKR